MSLAIKFGDSLDSSTTSGFIYIDAVTQYNRDFKGQVTSHPIGSGGNISDHFIRNNPVYNITGVISGADISIGKEKIKGESGDTPLNIVSSDIPPVSIKGNNSNLLSLLPDSISQFFVDAGSSVTTASSNTRRDVLNTIRTLLEGLFDKDGLSLITLYEYKNNKLDKVIDPLVMTSLTFNEDPDSGLALYITMSLEQVTFVELKRTVLDKKDLAKLDPKKVSEPVKNLSAPNTNLGSKPNILLQSEEEKKRIKEEQNKINKSSLKILLQTGGLNS